MDIRLVKLASEYNVGYVHLAEFLNSKGVGVETSPGAKVAVTDDLRKTLDKHYSKDLAAKKQADQMKPAPKEVTPTPPRAEKAVVPPVVDAPKPEEQKAKIAAPEPVAPKVTAELVKSVPKSDTETNETKPAAPEKPRTEEVRAPKVETKAEQSKEKPSGEKNDRKNEPRSDDRREPKTDASKSNEPKRNDNRNDSRNEGRTNEPRKEGSVNNDRNRSDRNNEPRKEGSVNNDRNRNDRNKPRTDKPIETKIGSKQDDAPKPVLPPRERQPEPVIERRELEPARGLKVLGKINLVSEEKLTPDERKARERDRKERERKERIARERKEQKAREVAQKNHDRKQEDLRKEQEVVLKKEADVKERAERVQKQEESVIRASDSAQSYKLAGTKVLGRIELPVDSSKESAEDKKRKRKRKKVARGGVTDLNKVVADINTTGSGTNSNANTTTRQGGNRGGGTGTNNNRPAGTGNNNRTGTGAGGNNNRPAGTGGNRPAGAGGTNNRTGTGNNRPGNNRNAPATTNNQPAEVSKKDVEDKIRSTMARLGGAGKNARTNMRRGKRDRLREKQAARDEQEISTKLQVTEFVSANELSSLMNVTTTEVLTTCINLGYMVSINQRLDAELIEIIAEEFGFEVEFQTAEDDSDLEDAFVDEPGDVLARGPIVTVMGHVDHGKTSLLDFIHKKNIVSGEAGGITQHLGAYEAYVGQGAARRKITFLDTPGHEAFTAMRARGTKVTDVAIIIIAADDGIMPTTQEAISHAQAANVPMIFAINKIDKENANPDRVREQLSQMNILVEEWGGKYQCQEIAAKKGTGVDELLEKILLEAEMLELTANAKRPATGTILEASLDKGRGYVAKILVQNGTLRKGDIVLAGQHFGRMRNMFDEHNKVIKEAGPSTPVLVLGLSGAPQAGDIFKVMTSESDARTIAAKRAQINRNQEVRATKRISLDEIGRRLALGNFKELKLIIKGDFDGSVEALSDSLLRLSTEQVQVNIIYRAVGAITESDINLASASDAIILGFQVRPAGNARQKAEQEGVQIKAYSVIYEAIEEIKLAIEGMLEPTKEEKIICTAEVRATFPVKRIGTIIGAFMQDGKITRNTKIRVIRNGIVVFPVKENQEGALGSLKRFTDDVREVAKGFEFGMTIKDFNDIQVGDTIEGYEIIEIKQKL
jgi:translation initiation factor IF-2